MTLTFALSSICPVPSSSFINSFLIFVMSMQCVQTSRAEAAAEEAQKARDEAARSISDSMLQQDAAMKQAQQAREASSEAHHQLQKARQAELAAEQQR